MSSPKVASAPAKKSTKATEPAAAPASSLSPVTTTASAPAPLASVVTPLDPGVATQCVALLAQVDGLLGPVRPLSASQARRMLKLRKGGAQVIPDLANLCGQHGIPSVGPITVAAMTASLQEATLLNHVSVQLEILRKHLTDATFSAESQAWQNATALYTVLQRIALVDPTLANGLKPIQAFFKTKRTKGYVRQNVNARKLKAAQKLVAANAASNPGPATLSAPPAAAGEGAPTVPEPPN